MNLWRRRPFVLATVAAIGVTLMFPALAVVLIARLGDAVERAAAGDRIRVFLATMQPDEVARVRDVLESSPEVGAVELVTPAQAREAFARRFPELAEVMRELSEEDVALPATLEATISGGPEAASRIAARVRGLPAVEAVGHDEDWSREVGRLSRALDAARSVIAALALGVAAFGIGNVIRINALSRREELAIMRLVGAPGFHLRVPFVIEGVVQGAIGGLVAALLVTAVTWLLGPHLDRLVPAPAEGSLRGLTMVLVVGSACAGMVGAAIAVEGVLRRHARLER